MPVALADQRQLPVRGLRDLVVHGLVIVLAQVFHRRAGNLQQDVVYLYATALNGQDQRRDGKMVPPVPGRAGQATLAARGRRVHAAMDGVARGASAEPQDLLVPVWGRAVIVGQRRDLE